MLNRILVYLTHAAKLPSDWKKVETCMTPTCMRNILAISIFISFWSTLWSRLVTCSSTGLLEMTAGAPPAPGADDMPPLE